MIPLSELHDFNGHPFKVENDMALFELMQSIEKEGVIVENSKGGINSCDIPYSDDLQQFNRDYLALTAQSANECKNTELEDCMVVGTSALPQTELDSIVNQYSGIYNNPFLAWGRYRKGFFKTTLPVSLQFHHAQMDGSHAAKFLDALQKEIFNII